MSYITSGCQRKVNETNLSPDSHNVFFQDKPASMSSVLVGGAGCCVAENGNDGIYSGETFHTKNEANPWWRVDMQEVYCIHAVYFMNRFEPTLHQGETFNLCKYQICAES